MVSSVVLFQAVSKLALELRVTYGDRGVKQVCYLRAFC